MLVTSAAGFTDVVVASVDAGSAAVGVALEDVVTAVVVAAAVLWETVVASEVDDAGDASIVEVC